MRSLVLAALCTVTIACDSSGSSLPPGQYAEKPQVCKDHCVVDEPPRSWEDCCDSTTCYVDPDTGGWVVVHCDPPPDPCALCKPDELCVAHHDGTCTTSGPRCVPRTVDCPGNACSSACEAAYCPSPYQCQVRSPCGGESPLAFTCYGP